MVHHITDVIYGQDENRMYIFFRITETSLNRINVIQKKDEILKFKNLKSYKNFINFFFFFLYNFVYFIHLFRLNVIHNIMKGQSIIMMHALFYV